MFYQSALDYIKRYTVKKKIKSHLNKRQLSFITIGKGVMGTYHTQNFKNLGINFNGYFNLSYNSKHKRVSSKLSHVLIKNVDFVILSTPNKYHYEYLKFFSNFKNIYVFVDKPLVISRNEYLDLSKINKIFLNKIFLAFNLNFQSNFIYLKKYFSGQSKKIIKVKSVWHRNIDLNIKNSAHNYLLSGGGVLIDWGSHILGLISDIFEIKSFEIIDANFNQKIINEKNNILETSCEINSKINNFIFEINLSWESSVSIPLKIDFYLDDNSIICWHKNGLVEHFNNNNKRKSLFNSKYSNIYHYFILNIFKNEISNSFSKYDFISNFIDLSYKRLIKKL